MTATILITGANGQVGHELAVGRSAHRLIALERCDLDITDAQRIAAAFEEYRPDLVINAAAYTQVDQAETDRELAFAINCDGARNLADACRRRDIPMLHVSTDYVFSGDDPGEYLEDDATNPYSVYGESKLAGELALRERLAKHVILRTSWVFSATGNNFVKTMLRLGRERAELAIIGDQRGCPTSARSIAQTLLEIGDRCLGGESPGWGTYHYRNAPVTTWYDFARRIFEQAGGYDKLQVKRITTAQYPTPARRPLNSVLNCDKLKQAFGITPVAWQDELELVLEALRKEG